MAGLFELQLPNESRRRRSSDVADPRRSTSTRSDSPTPEDTAREIVSQLVAKQQSSPSQSTLSSILPWRRKAAAVAIPTGLPPTTGRKSADTRIARPSFSPDSNPLKIRPSVRPTPGRTSASPRPSLSVDTAYGLSSPPPPSPAASHNDEMVSGNATKALAQAGLGLSLPQIAFPRPTSPISKHIPKRKLARPGTSHGTEQAFLAGTSSKGDSVRRVRSFSKLQDTEQSVSELPPSVSHGHAQLKLPQSISMPEIPSNTGSFKGKEPETQPQLNNRDLSGREESSRGGQNQGALSLFQRERSVTRRTWWPGRRTVDSPPVDTRAPLPAAAPPPLPVRSQHRPPPPIKAPAPILPSFQPFSPLLNDFSISADSNSNRSLSELRNEYDDVHSDSGSSIPQTRDSLDRRILAGPSGSFSPKHPSKQASRTTPQVHPRSHRHSHSLGSSDFGHLPLSAILFTENSASGQLSKAPFRRPKSAADTSSGARERRRSLTIFGRPSSPMTSSLVSSRDGLLLSQPVPRLSQGDTRLSSQEIGLQHTSTGSLTNLSQSLLGSRTARPRSGTTPSTSDSLGGSTSSLPPPTSSGRLLRRLSSTFFTTPSTPIATSSVDPSSVHSLNASGPLNAAWSSTTSSSGRSKESLGDGHKTSEEGARRKAGKTPIRLPDETPEHFLSRLTDSMGRGEIIHALAGSGGEFYLQATGLYFSRFNFTGDPLDVAVRRLLMEIGLPRETQQIDRVMEAFAARYLKCNPELFVDKDHPYILAFSLIMLHTDAFNKSNKNKMTKADYVKNAKLPGIPTEVLECFFDNIIFAPFIFIEDPEDIPSKNQVNEGPSRFNGGSPPTMLTATSGGGTLLGKSNKIDPYYLITRNLLDPLRADIGIHVPNTNPYLYEGTDWPWDTQHLHQLFARAQQVQVNADLSSPSVSIPGSGTSTPSRRKSIAMPSFAMGYGPFIGTQSFTTFEFSPQRPTAGRTDGLRMIRIAKAGVLSRKDDTTEGGKRAVNRKWREWSVVLTATQLLFFRDLNFASQLLALTPGGEFQDPAIQETLLHPDEVVSLYETIAVFDTTYTKKLHAFRLFLPNGRQFIIQCSEKHALNEWISTINYAGAFRSAGVRMRGIGISHKEAETMGLAAAASHLSDRGVSAAGAFTLPLASTSTSPSPVTPISGSPHPPLRSTQLNPSSELLKALSSSPGRRYEETSQLKNTFQEVKAELAANAPMEESSKQLRTPTPISISPTRARTLSVSATRAPSTPTTKQVRRPSTASSTSRSEEKAQTISRSRVDVVQSRALLLDFQIKQIQRHLDEELRIVRNLAILTPFQRASRDRIQSAVVNVAKKVRSLRIDLTQHVCHHFVLLSDLADEEREREQVKRDAMEAATRRLSIAESRPQPPLQIVTSSHLYDPTSSSYDSFHSALDGSERNEPTLLLGPVFASEPRPLHQDTTTPTQSPALMHAELGSPSAVEGHEKFYTAVETAEEIAEEWNETRAAKRVSLVHVPSEIRLAILNRQLRTPSNEPT